MYESRRQPEKFCYFAPGVAPPTNSTRVAYLLKFLYMMSTMARVINQPIRQTKKTNTNINVCKQLMQWSKLHRIFHNFYN